MAHDISHTSLGGVLRKARKQKDLSLRDLAKKLKKTPSYLSDIERNLRIPAEDMLHDLACLLDLDFDDLMARAGRLGKRAVRYMMKTPAAGILFRKISDCNFQEEQLKQLAAHVDEIVEKRSV